MVGEVSVLGWFSELGMVRKLTRAAEQPRELKMNC